MLQLLLFNVTNGLIIGAFYVLMALGLSLILNLSNVINFAHGGFLVVGGYIAYTITPYVGFWGALLIAPPLTALIGLIVERVLIRPLYGRDPLYSLLLTFGLAFIFEDGTRFIWGAQGKPVTVPALLAQPLSSEFFFITGYRLFMVAVVIVAVGVLFVLLRYSRLGIRIRAGTLDLETVSALGVNVQLRVTVPRDVMHEQRRDQPERIAPLSRRDRVVSGPDERSALLRVGDSGPGRVDQVLLDAVR